MLDRRTFVHAATDSRRAVSGRGLAWLALVAAICSASVFEVARAQAPPSSPPPSQQPSIGAEPAAPETPSSPPPAGNPGLLEEMGKLFRKSTSIFSWPSETIDDLNARTKSATDSLGRLARPASVANGRVVCQVAPNGAPDCKTAADKLCQSKGYTGGNSIESDAAESCPARVLMSGRPPEPGECRTDNYVTRALCQ